MKIRSVGHSSNTGIWSGLVEGAENEEEGIVTSPQQANLKSLYSSRQSAIRIGSNHTF
jgi:hypothetical protein